METNTTEVPTKFTQEIKDNWIANLESGNYKQGFSQLYVKRDNSFCCIGVLGHVTKGLDNDYKENEKNPYDFLQRTIGEPAMTILYETNDEDSDNTEYPRDYSNVIDLVKALPVQS